MPKCTCVSVTYILIVCTPECRTNIHIHLTIFGVVTLYVDVLSLPWYWRTYCAFLIDPQALTGFEKGTWTVISYCLKNGRDRLVSISIIISAACKIDEFTTSSTCNVKTLLLSNLRPLTPGNQNSSSNIDFIIESRVQSTVQSRVQSPGFFTVPALNCDATFCMNIATFWNTALAVQLFHGSWSYAWWAFQWHIFCPNLKRF